MPLVRLTSGTRGPFVWIKKKEENVELQDPCHGHGAYVRMAHTPVYVPYAVQRMCVWQGHEERWVWSFLLDQ